MSLVTPKVRAMLRQAEAVLAAHGMAPASAPAGKRPPAVKKPKMSDDEMRAILGIAPAPEVKPAAPEPEPTPRERPSGRPLDLSHGLARSLRNANLSPARTAGRVLVFLHDGAVELANLAAVVRWLAVWDPQLAEKLEHVAEGATGWTIPTLRLLKSESSSSSVVGAIRIVDVPRGPRR